MLISGISLSVSLSHLGEATKGYSMPQWSLQSGVFLAEGKDYAKSLKGWGARGASWSALMGTWPGQIPVKIPVRVGILISGSSREFLHGLYFEDLVK